MNKISLLLLASAGLGANAAFAQNVWLAEPGALSVTPAHTYQSFDEFHAGTAKMALPADITQRTTGVRIDYGLAPRLALDAELGYTQVKFKPPGASFKRSGRDDARLGLSYALLGESAELPAVTARVGAIFAGSYDVPTSVPPINPGDGASGFEVSFAYGKDLGDGFLAYGESGYRNRNRGVPDDYFGSFGAAKRLGAATLSLGYRRIQGLSGGDIGGPGFGARFGFPGVKELKQFVEAGVSFADAGDRSYQFGFAKHVGSLRNTGRATVWTFSVSLPFRP
jgi:hypothetical protein